MYTTISALLNFFKCVNAVIYYYYYYYYYYYNKSSEVVNSSLTIIQRPGN